MPAPGLALAGQKPAAKARLQQAPADLGFGVVRCVVQHNVPDRLRFIDDEHAAPKNALVNDVGGETLRRISDCGVFAHGAERLPEVAAAIALWRQSNDRY